MSNKTNSEIVLYKSLLVMQMRHYAVESSFISKAPIKFG